ncbi:MAG: 1-(5-phosphoribosyl)-5-[(5-phosphoribosylamino)methylideneamino]imidazole-4-carboxamide isomerase [Desulfobacterales bacterium]|nr:1-(5-phosphoribosyl)-5-[(5-phosphoribosylamino)methylideneamino]imidazole-4-carboxamide isomerase [Desulfobacterales bacterium]MBS3755463.1 1-(5-phosphoribosyl)-5-[(5-phosphoribosylamino)methylideneamino]imidazole-4-carboxamide isomerase [Desulfobacterales bacterium]
MIVIPAIDIKGGKCVRLLQGEMNRETVFSDDPASMAEKWIRAGAELIHVVDLDGAVEKRPRNLEAIGRIVEAAGAVPVQVGGGIRDAETLEMYLDRGVGRAVIGSVAIYDPDMVKAACKRYPGRIVLAIDARNGRVAIEGWTQTTEMSAADLARQFEDSGVAAINFTDIERDGMQTGPNISAIREFARAINIPVVASGGVSSLADIKRLADLEPDGVVGVITGRAIYDGSLDLQSALAFLQEEKSE